MLDYRFLLLDADGTFLDFSATERIAINRLFEKLSLPSSEALLSSYHKANSRCWQALENGVLSMKDLEEERFRLFFTNEGIERNAHEASEIYIEELSKAAFYIDGAKEMLETLSSAYTLALITNGIPRVQRGRLSRLDAEKYFSHIFISGEIGSSKPSTAFFDTVLNSLGAKRSECLVIGDSLTSDMKGAVDSGIDALYLNFKGEKAPEDLGVRYNAGSYEELLSILL